MDLGDVGTHTVIDSRAGPNPIIKNEGYQIENDGLGEVNMLPAYPLALCTLICLHQQRIDEFLYLILCNSRWPPCLLFSVILFSLTSSMLISWSA